MKNILITAIVFTFTCSLYAQKQIEIEADGNLESPNPLACVALSEVTSLHNPVDILHGVKKCIEAAEYEKAVKLFALSGVFGRYDTYRVKDKTAHQALQIAQQMILENISEQQKEYFIENFKSQFGQGSDNLQKNCQSIQTIGVPKYFPRYMIQHGINAFTDKNDTGINENFDSEQSWKSALESYLHCN